MSSARIEAENAIVQHLGNAFLVLELEADASRLDVERQGAKLLAMLAAGLDGANRYPTPLGPRERGPEAVRAALSALRDPEQRLVHEWWLAAFGELP